VFAGRKRGNYLRTAGPEKALLFNSKEKGGNYAEEIVTVPYDHGCDGCLAAWIRLFEA
jgi:hypothetical protein